jgi:hypothetical protein
MTFHDSDSPERHPDKTDAKTVLEKYAVMEFNIRNSTRPEVSAAELALLETRAALAASDARVEAGRQIVHILRRDFYGDYSGDLREALAVWDKLAALAAGEPQQGPDAA